MSPHVDAYTAALTWLSRRELSTRQLRDRLARRQFDPAQIDAALDRLTRDGTVDDRRVARAAARLEAGVRRRGRRRVLQQLQRLGIEPETAEEAVAEAFAEIDESASLEHALARRLKGADPRSLDRAAVARVVRSLAGLGFAPSAVYARLRRGRAEPDE